MTLNEEWTKDIQKVARKAAYDWPGVIEEEDLVQEVWLHILEAPGTQQDLGEMDSRARYQTLHKIAQRIASQERVDYEVFSGNFRYSVDEVRSLLEAAGDPAGISLRSSWSSGDFTKSGSDHSDQTATTAIANLAVSSAHTDLAAALADLKGSNSGQHDALVTRFIYGVVPVRTDTAAFMVIERGLISLTTKMNHAHKRQHADRPDGPGTRAAISKSIAHRESKRGWDAEYTPLPAHLRDNRIEPEVWQ